MSAKGTNGSAKVQGRSSTERMDGSPGVWARRPEMLRNIALVGRSGAGKTMLAEALLAATGVISRMGSIVDGTTVSDSDPSEIHQQRSVAGKHSRRAWRISRTCIVAALCFCC